MFCCSNKKSVLTLQPYCWEMLETCDLHVSRSCLTNLCFSCTRAGLAQVGWSKTFRVVYFFLWVDWDSDKTNGLLPQDGIPAVSLLLVLPALAKYIMSSSSCHRWSRRMPGPTLPALRYACNNNNNSVSFVYIIHIHIPIHNSYTYSYTYILSLHACQTYMHFVWSGPDEPGFWFRAQPRKLNCLIVELEATSWIV